MFALIGPSKTVETDSHRVLDICLVMVHFGEWLEHNPALPQGCKRLEPIELSNICTLLVQTRRQGQPLT